MLNKSTSGILSIEEKNNLYAIQYKDIPIWELIRYKVFIQLQDKSNSPSNKPVNNSPFKLFEKIFYCLVPANPFLYIKKKQTLILRSSRKRVSNATFVDPHTQYFETVLNKKDYEAYETDFFHHKTFDFTPNLILIKYLGIVFSKIMLLFYRKSLTKKLNSTISPLISLFPDIDLKNLVLKNYSTFLIENCLYKLLLKIKKPSKIYLVNYINKASLIYAAKNIGIKTIEIQHGFTSPQLFLYHYPKWPKNTLKLFPDEFLYIDKLYHYKVDIPLTNSNIKPFEGDFFIKKREEYLSSIKKNNENVLFISQDILFDEFINFVEQFALSVKASLTNLNISYKPHPNDYKIIKPSQIKKLENLGVNFIDKNDDIYKHIASSKHIVGVYSTALIEALNYNSICYSLNISGRENISHFIDDKIIIDIDSVEQLLKQIQKHS